MAEIKEIEDEIKIVDETKKKIGKVKLSGLTKAEAVKIMDDIPAAKVRKAYDLAVQRKASGRLNLDDIERSLGTINDKKRKAKSSMTSDKAYVVKKNMGGSMGGGMNPMGRSPDPTVESVTGYNPNTPMMRKKGGAIKRRGGGIAKRGMGIAK